MSEPSPPLAGHVRRRGVEQAAERRRDRPDPLRLRARWVPAVLALAAAGRPAIVVLLVTPVAIAVAASLGWFR